MAKRVLDTSVLVSWWRQQRNKVNGRGTLEEVRKWAKELIEVWDSKSIVSPVVVEFLAGSRDEAELKLYRAFLAEFETIDSREIPASDWVFAEGLAERIPRNSRPRDLGDCLILAIANRLRYEVKSLDSGVRGGNSLSPRSKRRRK